MQRERSEATSPRGNRVERWRHGTVVGDEAASWIGWVKCSQPRSCGNEHRFQLGNGGTPYLRLRQSREMKP